MSYKYMFATANVNSAIDNEYLIDGFMVILSQYNQNKIVTINDKINVRYNNSFIDENNIKFTSTKHFFDSQIKKNCKIKQ